MDFLRDPDGYDAAKSWARAVRRCRRRARGAARGAGTRVRRRSARRAGPARAHADGRPARGGAVRRRMGRGGAATGRRAARRPARSPRPSAPTRSSRPGPLAASAHAAAGLAALRLIQQSTPLAVAGTEEPRVLPPDPEPAMHHAFALIYTWMAARADEHVVYGPRFAVYSAVVQLPDGLGPRSTWMRRCARTPT